MLSNVTVFYLIILNCYEQANLNQQTIYYRSKLSNDFWFARLTQFSM